MEEKKKTAIIYAEWHEVFDDLDDDEAGRLAKHLFRYINDIDTSNPDKLTKRLFIQMKHSLDRNNVKYQEMLEAKSEAGKKSAEAKKQRALELKQQEERLKQLIDSNEKENESSQHNSTDSTPVDFVPTHSTKSTDSDSESVSGNDSDSVSDSVLLKKELEISEEEIFPQNPNAQLNNHLNIQTKNQPPIAQPPLLFSTTEESPKTSAKPPKVTKEPKVKKPNPHVNPQDDFHEDPKLNAALKMFVQARKNKRVPVSENAMRLILLDLEEFTVEEVTKAVIVACKNDHQGVFPRKERQNNSNIGAGNKLPEKMNYTSNM